MSSVPPPPATPEALHQALVDAGYAAPLPSALCLPGCDDPVEGLTPMEYLGALADAEARNPLAEPALAAAVALALKRSLTKAEITSCIKAWGKRVAEARAAAAAKADPPRTIWRADPEPWKEAVTTRAAFSEVRDLLGQYVHASPATLSLAAGLVLTTWVVEALDFVPYANISSPAKRCGKSRLMILMASVSARALATVNLSPAGLYRAIDGQHPALFIDEVDVLRESDAWAAMVGIINGGNDRETSNVIRVGGEDRDEVQTIDAFGVKVLSGIGRLDGPTGDRCLDLRLERRPRGVRVENLRMRALRPVTAEIRSRLERWAQDEGRTRVGNLLDDARAHLLLLAGRSGSDNDRLIDMLEPIFAVAMMDDTGMVCEALDAAALTLFRADAEEAAGGDELLADIGLLLANVRASAADGGIWPGAHVVGSTRAAADEKGQYRRLPPGRVRISVVALASALAALPEGKWATAARGKPLTANMLRRMLKAYRLLPENVKVAGTAADFDTGPTGRLVVLKGYTSEDLEVAITRYAPSPASDEDGAAPPPDSPNDDGEEAFDPLS